MSDKPYRPNVGIALFNANGHVLIARRFQDDGPEVIYPGLEWQMPQGGIDPAEDPRPAAQRELYEEQKWVAFRFVGDEREITVTDVRNGQPVEFDAWRWEPLANVPSLVVPFRREVYRSVAKAFARFGR